MKTENGGVTNFHTTEISYTSEQHYNSRLRKAVSLQLKKDHFNQNIHNTTCSGMSAIFKN